MIRLITRLIFCWFLQEKGLIPRGLFRSGSLRNLLEDFSPKSGSYYNAILQNLFFATLNQEQDKRVFRDKKEKGWYDSNRGVTNLFRYQDQIKNEPEFLALLKTPPFVNGGLFDCLDRVYKAGGQANVRLDGFSDNPKESVFLPNEIFFGEERSVDLSDVYEDKSHGSEKVRGLIETLSRYKFTVEENTPLEQEVALDPELLGKVFENLLASYNPDTRTTARKATGSFYTPREIVRYMVDEALVDYFRGQLDSNGEDPELGATLRRVLNASVNEFHNPLTEKQTEALIAAIDNAKVLDPACGSGAFPMGVLQRLVDLLSKFDPNNKRWKEQQRQRAIRDKLLAEKMEDEENRENALRDIEARIADNGIIGEGPSQAALTATAQTVKIVSGTSLRSFGNCIKESSWRDSGVPKRLEFRATPYPVFRTYSGEGGWKSFAEADIFLTDFLRGRGCDGAWGSAIPSGGFAWTQPGAFFSAGNEPSHCRPRPQTPCYCWLRTRAT